MASVKSNTRRILPLPQLFATGLRVPITEGIFFGVNGIASLYKFGSDKFDPNYSKGYYYGGGLSAGYSHELSKHWNIEVELGGSVIHTRYDLLSEKDVVISKDLARTLILPTRVSLSIVYVP